RSSSPRAGAKAQQVSSSSMADAGGCDMDRVLSVHMTWAGPSEEPFGLVELSQPLLHVPSSSATGASPCRPPQRLKLTMDVELLGSRDADRATPPLLGLLAPAASALVPKPHHDPVVFMCIA